MASCGAFLQKAPQSRKTFSMLFGRGILEFPIQVKDSKLGINRNSVWLVLVLRLASQVKH